MSATPEKAANAATGWIGQAVQALVIVITTWQLFATEIHGYIDTKMDAMEQNMVRKVGATTSGQMLQLVDSVDKRMQAYQDTNVKRLNNIEELIGVRPSNRTIIVPPDTAAIQRLQWQMRQVESGIERILDGQAEAAGQRRLRHTPKVHPVE